MYKNINLLLNNNNLLQRKLNVFNYSSKKIFFNKLFNKIKFFINFNKFIKVKSIKSGNFKINYLLIFLNFLFFAVCILFF